MILYALAGIGGLVITYFAVVFVASLFGAFRDSPDARIERERGRANRP